MLANGKLTRGTQPDTTDTAKASPPPMCVSSLGGGPSLAWLSEQRCFPEVRPSQASRYAPLPSCRICDDEASLA
jgi:hypothetical protein